MKNNFLIGIGFFGALFVLFAALEHYASVAFIAWGVVAWWAWAQMKKDSNALKSYPALVEGVLTFAAASVVLAIPVAVIALIVLLSHLHRVE